ncbi:MAG: hypothetical protein QOJ16_1053, partial [Acidobacteriota bacterium]|nr:hypothetical protein [Acidobacteriota bacterium]
MTSRFILLTFTALLLTASLATASTPATPATDTPAFLTSTAASPGCAATDLPFLTPAPSQRTGNPCGPCSDSPCQGTTTGTFCGYQGGRTYTCQIVYGGSC